MPAFRSLSAAILAAILIAALAPGLAAAQCDPTAPDCFESSSEPPSVMIGEALPAGEQQVELRVYYSDDHWLDAQSVQVTVTGGTITSNTFSPEPGDPRSASSRVAVTLAPGQNTLTARIADDLGQVTTASQTFTYTPPPAPALRMAPVLSAEPHNGVNRNLALCDGCSEAVLSHSTPAYVSLDQARSVTLFYSSAQAASRAFLQLDATDPSQDPASYMTFRAAMAGGYDATLVSGSTHSSQTWYYARGAGVNRLGAQGNAGSLGTGSHLLTAEVTSHWADASTLSQSLPLRLAVINEASSPIGDGWSIAGLQRIHSGSDGVAITDGAGHLIFFSGTCTVAPCTYAAPDGEFSTLVKVTTSGADEFRRTYPDGGTADFDNSGLLLRAADRYGSTTYYGYTGGLLTSITDPAGLVTQLAYVNGLLRTITDPVARVTTLTHDSGGRLTSIQDPTGAVVLSATYDANGRVTGWTDVRQGQWNVHYGFTARVDSIVAPAVQTADGPRRPVTRVRSLESRVMVSSAVGSLSAMRPVVIPDSAHVVVTGSMGAQERIWSDGYGLATRIQGPDGRETHVRRNSDGLPEYVEDDDGNASWATYADHRVTETTQRTVAGLVKTEIEYGAFSLPIRVTTEGVSVHYAYLANGAPDSTYVGDVRTWYTTDARGRVETIRDSEGSTSYASYLSSGVQNTYQVTDAEGRWARFGYDAAGRRTTVTLPGSLVTTTAYDALNRVDAVTDPAGLTTTMFYNGSRPQADSVRDARGMRRRFRYNALGWTTSETNALGDSLLWQYDVGGNVTKRTDATGRVASATYDSLARVLTRRDSTAAGIATTTYAYDPDRRWVAASNAASTDTLFYHAEGRLLKAVTRRPGGLRFQTDYGYTGLEQLQRVALTRPSGDTISFAYSYDGIGRLNGIRDILTELEVRDSNTPVGSGIANRTTSIWYNTRGLPRQANLPGAGSMSFTYSPAGQLDEATLSSSASDPEIYRLNREYSYTNLGQIHERLIPDPDGALEDRYLRRFTYDVSGRLKRYDDYATGEEWVCSDPFDLNSCGSQPFETLLDSAAFAWDPVGNPTGAGAVVNAANRLTSYDGWTLGYDAAGYLTSRSKSGVPSQSLAWNALGQLTSVTTSGAGTVSFQYDGFGRRVTRVAPSGAVRRYIYDGDHVLMETNGSGSTERMYSYYPGVDQPHSVREFMGSVAGRYYYTMELPGHVSGLVDATGVVVNRYLYSAFGKPEVLQEGVPNTLRYMAREWDADAGLYYVRNRWYDPQVGRFISEDPIGIAGGINLYAYVGNDPANFTDPYGLECPSCLAPLVITFSCSANGMEVNAAGGCSVPRDHRAGGLSWLAKAAEGYRNWQRNRAESLAEIEREHGPIAYATFDVPVGNPLTAGRTVLGHFPGVPLQRFPDNSPDPESYTFAG